MTKDNSNIITIYDKQYDQTNFNDKQKEIVLHLKVLGRKVTDLRFELNQASVAQEAFINKLLESLEEPKEEKDVG